MKNKSKAGQSMIEFSLVAVIFVGMLSLSFNAILGFCVQQYISYAVFMTARSYQAARGSSAENMRAAKAAFAGYFPEVSASGQGPVEFGTLKVATITAVVFPQAMDHDYGPANEKSKVQVFFEVPLVMLPIGKEMKGYAKIPLDAASYLGREVSQAECKKWFRDFMSAFEMSGAGMSKYNSYAGKYSGNMDDNGC